MEWQPFLSERKVGVVATVGPDGGPHAVPVEIVLDDGKVYCWCRAGSVKARNVARAGRAALTAYKGNRMVLVRGRARLIREGEERYDRITHAFLAKYDRDDPYGNDTLIEIVPERVAVKDR